MKIVAVGFGPAGTAALRTNHKVDLTVGSSTGPCMNDQMDDNETLSISAWEKTGKGKVAMAACDKRSGWDKK